MIVGKKYIYFLTSHTFIIENRNDRLCHSGKEIGCFGHNFYTTFSCAHVSQIYQLPVCNLPVGCPLDWVHVIVTPVDEMLSAVNVIPHVSSLVECRIYCFTSSEESASVFSAILNCGM